MEKSYLKAVREENRCLSSSGLVAGPGYDELHVIQAYPKIQ